MSTVTTRNMAEKIREAKSLLDYLNEIEEDVDAIIALVQRNQHWFDARPGQSAIAAARLKLERLVG